MADARLAILVPLVCFATIGAVRVVCVFYTAIRDAAQTRAMRHSHSRAWTRLSSLEHRLRCSMRVVLQVNPGGTITVYVPDDRPEMPDGYCYAKDAPSLGAALDELGGQ